MKKRTRDAQAQFAMVGMTGNPFIMLCALAEYVDAEQADETWSFDDREYANLKGMTFDDYSEMIDYHEGVFRNV